jgi:hypothetical protein
VLRRRRRRRWWQRRLRSLWQAGLPQTQEAEEELGDEPEHVLGEVADDGERAPSAKEHSLEGAAGVSHRSPEKRVPSGLRVVAPVLLCHTGCHAALLRAPEVEHAPDGAAAERHRALKKTVARTLRHPRHLRSLPVLGVLDVPILNGDEFPVSPASLQPRWTGWAAGQFLAAGKFLLLGLDGER